MQLLYMIIGLVITVIFIYIGKIVNDYVRRIIRGVPKECMLCTKITTSKKYYANDRYRVVYSCNNTECSKRNGKTFKAERANYKYWEEDKRRKIIFNIIGIIIWVVLPMLILMVAIGLSQ